MRDYVAKSVVHEHLWCRVFSGSRGSMWANQGFTRVYRYVVASMVHEDLYVRVSGPTICTSRLSIIFSKVNIPEIVNYSP